MIDTLYIAKQIPISAEVEDAIITKSVIDGELGLNMSDSLNLVLSGAPSLSVNMPQQVNWEAIIIGVLGIVVNAFIVYFTFRSKKKLQELETQEIRIRKTQDIEIEKQTELYRLLVNLNDPTKDAPTQNAAFELPGLPNSNLIRKIDYARKYINHNKLYINDELESIALKIIDLYDPSINKQLSLADGETIENKLKDYVNTYNKC